MKCYLRLGDDTIFDARRFDTKAAAVESFHAVATELDRYGQRIEATLHYARTQDELHEDPDFTLKLGPRGGVACERA